MNRGDQPFEGSLSYAPAVPEGASRLASRVARIALVPVAVVAFRAGPTFAVVLIIVVGIALVAFSAFIGAVRTLRVSVTEP